MRLASRAQTRHSGQVTVSAGEFYRRARDHLNAGRNAAARRDLARAAARTDDPDLRARIAGSTAALVIRQGDPAEAERLVRDALEREGLAPETRAMLHGQLGLLALERGALDEAVVELDLGIAGTGDDRDLRPAMLNNRSVAHMQSGALDKAVDDLERAVEDYLAAGEELRAAMAMHNAGYISLLSGDLVKALREMARARVVLEPTSAVNVAICDLDRAEVLRDAGMAGDAERGLRDVAQVFAAHRMPQARGEAEFHLARSLLAHAPIAAAGAAAKASRIFRRVESTWWAVRAEGVRLRALLSAASLTPPAARAPSHADIDRVAASLEQYGLASESLALRLSFELWRARAVGIADAAPVRVPRDAPIPVRLLAYEVRSARAAAAGRGPAARRHAAAGLDALADWQASFGSLDLASSLLLHGTRLIKAGIAAATASSRPDVIFDWSERARHLGIQSVPLRPPPDPELAAELAELRMLRADVGSSDWMAHPRARALSERVRERQWQVQGVGVSRERLSLDRFRDALDDATAYLTYLYDGQSLVALAVAGSTARVVRIEDWADVRSSLAALRADLDMSAAVRSGPLAASVETSLTARLAAVSRSLVAPVERVLDGRRIVLTIPGILGGLPWGMLPALRGRPMTIATSASHWAERPAHTQPAMVGFAVGPRVARGEEEVLRAAAHWRVSRIIAGASVADVTGLAEQADLLHVAAHGRHSRDHPLFSGLDLADGTLFGYDIDLVARVPDVVVMSSCEVGRSTVRGGEEAIGMTRIWLHAGTACVIAAPVTVADDVACELLGAMHGHLAAGLAPAEALAAATNETGVVSPFLAHGSGF